MQSNPEKPIISVIVPYYQEETGILSKAIESALQQTNIDHIDLEIFIIDDESPIPAQKELPQSILDMKNIHIIKQNNTGPAGARNKGLNTIPNQTRYVAFLDSDDCWEPNHLSQAWKALEAGYDFYFSDFYQLEQSVSAFNRAKRINITEHPLLFEKNSSLHQYVGNMTEQIVTGNIIGTSTVVYRYQNNIDLRFREDLIRAGEDYLFWLSLTTNTDKIAFSSHCECVYGKGINVYSGTQYGTTEYLELVYYEIKYKKIILDEFNLNSELKNKLRNHISKQQENFVLSYLSQLKKRKTHLSLAIKFIQISPTAFFLTPYYILKRVTVQRQ